MALLKIADLYPDYKDDIFGGDDIKKFTVYTDNEERIGGVYDVLVDEAGRFRYLVVNTGFLGIGKKVLLPIGLANIDYDRDRVFVPGFTKEQGKNLPEYDDNMTVDYDYEERVRNSFRGTGAVAGGAAAAAATSSYDRNSYNYDRHDSNLFGMGNGGRQSFNQYQERLMANRSKFKQAGSASDKSLYKLGDLYPDYKNDIFGGRDIKGDAVYSDTDERIGTIYDILVDGGGSFRYFVVNTGFLGIGKKLLMPVGRTRIDAEHNRVYASGFTKQQAESLPEYHDDMTVDYDYEENVRSKYRAAQPGVAPLEGSAPVANDRNTYNYERDADLYNTSAPELQTLKLYEERLIANKERFRSGVVSIGKRVETETARVSVPVDKERVVIERKDPTSTTAVTPDATAFKEGEVARMEVYEETANVRKEAFVREEVSIHKEVDHETVNAQETIRREELEIDEKDTPTNPTNRSDRKKI
jgi:uncharacterized protein (TIGR02271 family)